MFWYNLCFQSLPEGFGNLHVKVEEGYEKVIDTEELYRWNQPRLYDQALSPKSYEGKLYKSKPLYVFFRTQVLCQ